MFTGCLGDSVEFLEGFRHLRSFIISVHFHRLVCRVSGHRVVLVVVMMGQESTTLRGRPFHRLRGIIGALRFRCSFREYRVLFFDDDDHFIAFVRALHLFFSMVRCVLRLVKTVHRVRIIFIVRPFASRWLWPVSVERRLRDGYV